MSKRSVFLYLSYRPEKTAARAARYARQIAKHCPDFDFAVLTYDHPHPTNKGVIDLDGQQTPHIVYGQEAAQRLPYPNKVGRKFVLKPLNVDVPTILFWKDHPDYQRYWVSEDDVEYTGDLGKLIASLQQLDADLLATHVRQLPGNWDYIPWFRGPNDNTVPKNCRLTFLPFHAITNRGLATLDEAYRMGWAGQYEMTWPAILDHAGLPIADIGGNGPYVAEGCRGKHYIDLSPTSYQKLGSFGTKHVRLGAGREAEILWHPVKPVPDWARMKIKRSISIWTYLWKKFSKRIPFSDRLGAARPQQSRHHF